MADLHHNDLAVSLYEVLKMMIGFGLLPYKWVRFQIIKNVKAFFYFAFTFFIFAFACLSILAEVFFKVEETFSKVAETSEKVEQEKVHNTICYSLFITTAGSMFAALRICHQSVPMEMPATSSSAATKMPTPIGALTTKSAVYWWMSQ